MKLLLDTHALLWFIAGSGSLSGHMRTLIEDVSNENVPAAQFAAVIPIGEFTPFLSIWLAPLRTVSHKMQPFSESAQSELTKGAVGCEVC